MTARPGTCIEMDDERVCRCGCGRQWVLGQIVALCALCVRARCAHPKAGVDVEQGRLL